MARERILPAAALPSSGAGSITTPFQFLVSGEDNLRIRMWDAANTARVTFSGRAVGLNGEISIFSRDIVGNGLRSPQTLLLSLAPGYVLSVAAQVQTSQVEHGAIFTQVDLVRGFSGALTTLGTLIQGYVGSVEGLAYPGSPIISPLDGPGRVYSNSLAAVAAGAQMTSAVPGGAAWEILNWTATLVTSPVVANRFVLLSAFDAFAHIWWRAPAAFAQTAGIFTSYHWAPHVAQQAIFASGAVSVPLPYPQRQPGGVFFTTGVLGFDALDQWQTGSITVREWLYPWSFGND